MYLKRTVQKNKDGSKRVYLQLAESYRIENKVKQRIICDFGRLDHLLEKGSLDRIIELLVEYSDTYKLKDLQIELFNEKTILYGPVVIFNKLWKELGMKEILFELIPKKEEKFNSILAIEQMVLSRLIEAGSKRALSVESEKLTLPGEKAFELYEFYRAMDELFPHIEGIEDRLFERRPYDLFNQKLDVIFFDTTSIKFYGEKPEKLMKRGHSKEKRRDLNQMVVGLLVDSQGIPLGHKIFAGNTVDVKTLKPVIEEFQRRFRIEKVILICDKGLMSEGNLKLLKELNWHYIIAGRLKNEKYIKEEVLKSKQSYTMIEESLLIKEVYNEKNETRYILCYNPVEGWDEYEQRQKMVEKLKEYEGQDTKKLVSNKGYRSYIKAGISKIMVDRAKIKEEVRYDGRYILKTNCDLPKEEVAVYYKSIIKVEQCFHQLKGEELIAPVYHWTERRVKTHVFICVLALIVRQTYVEKIKVFDGKLSEGDVWREIKNMHANIISINGMKYLIRQEPETLALKGFKACGIALPVRQKRLI